MPNRLAGESSPYLQQHAENPVEWYPWGPEAFAAARASQKPILLSIGYAACHWCHVMAHESFEDATTARMMNEQFVNVKVDREERPDVDAIYMQAVQAITGHGGWPMTMFLTPEGVPFFGGTYWPPEERHGMPSFRRILISVGEAWRTRRDDVLKGAASMREIYAATEGATAAGAGLTAEGWDAAVKSLARWYDPANGGFGRSPKFPQPQMLELLLLHWARTGDAESLEMARHSFAQMVRGGLHDQLGGGFHRYCVDAVWLVPHFEKMLYDNALLARLAVHLWQATGDVVAREVALRTLGWVEREMTDARGGWYASLDADSEGHEGTFYVWTLAELRSVLGEADAAVAAEYWGVTESGNFEGSNVLSVAKPLELLEPQRAQRNDGGVIERARDRLLAVREGRVRPARDEKVLAGWNALMLRAVAEAARAFDDAGLRERTLAAARFLRAEMMREGRVLRTWRDGVARIDGFLEDHAALALAFVSVYQLTFEREWLDAGLALHAVTVRDFWDAERGAWFDTARDAEPLVTRPRDVTDNAIPAGTSLAVELDLTVAVLRDDRIARQRGAYVLATLAEAMQRSPLAFGHLLCAADLALRGAVEVAVAGDAASATGRALRRAVAETYVPSLVMVGGTADDLPLMEGRTAGPAGAQAFVCRNYTCEVPTGDAAALRTQLVAARG